MCVECSALNGMVISYPFPARLGDHHRRDYDKKKIIRTRSQGRVGYNSIFWTSGHNRAAVVACARHKMKPVNARACRREGLVIPPPS